MIAVTGATGGLGSSVIRHLLTIDPDQHVVACAREPGKAMDLALEGVEVRRGDFDKPETLEEAFQGAERLLLVSASGIDRDIRVRQHRAAIEAAAQVGVGHVYYTSLAFADDSQAEVMQAHLSTETLLKESGLTFTVLRNGAYMESWPLYAGPLEGGGAQLPADGAVSWVSREDLAEGIAWLLVGGGRKGQTLHLTGPEALTLSETVSKVGNAQGRELKFEIVSEDVFVRRMVDDGKPEPFARAWATTYPAIARGELSTVDPLLERLLGRPLRTLDELLPTLLKV